MRILMKSSVVCAGCLKYLSSDISTGFICSGYLRILVKSSVACAECLNIRF
jgi:hypothetical protein